MTVKNRVAIVTGGAKGNGRGMVNALAAGGAKIVIFDFDKNLDNVVKELTDKG